MMVCTAKQHTHQNKDMRNLNENLVVQDLARDFLTATRKQDSNKRRMEAAVEGCTAAVDAVNAAAEATNDLIEAAVAEGLILKIAAQEEVISANEGLKSAEEVVGLDDEIVSNIKQGLIAARMGSDRDLEFSMGNAVVRVVHSAGKACGVVLSNPTKVKA